MGQGAESCGGYEVDYDEYDGDAMASGIWTKRDGSRIKLSAMTTSHLRGARRICKNMAISANFSDEEEKWEEWVDMFESEILGRGQEISPIAVYVSPEAIKPTRGLKLTMICHCGTEYQARKADIERGWGLSCSKRCSSIRREYKKPPAKQKQ